MRIWMRKDAVMALNYEQTFPSMIVQAKHFHQKANPEDGDHRRWANEIISNGWAVLAHTEETAWWKRRSSHSPSVVVGYDFGVSPTGLNVGSWVITGKEGVVGTREAIKLLGKLSLKGISIVFMGPQLIPKRQIVIGRKILTPPWVLAQYLTR